LHGGGLIHTIFGQNHAIVLELKTLYAYESVLFPIVTDAIQGIHVLIDTREYRSANHGEDLSLKTKERANIDAPLLNRIFNSFIQSFQIVFDFKSINIYNNPNNHYSSSSKDGTKKPSLIIRVNDSHEDFIIPPNPPTLVDEHGQHTASTSVLGPEEGTSQLCFDSPLFQIYKLICSPNKSLVSLCRDCSLFHETT
jgi:hypothetical protein